MKSMKKLDRFDSRAEALNYIRENVIGIRTPGDAERYLIDHIPKESYYQKKILDYIKANYPRAIAWKEAAGCYSRQGIPDVSACINGRYFGFEVKRPYFGKLSAMQKQTIERIRKAGGVAGVCIFPEDAEELIQEGLYNDDEQETKKGRG